MERKEELEEGGGECRDEMWMERKVRGRGGGGKGEWVRRGWRGEKRRRGRQKG